MLPLKCHLSFCWLLWKYKTKIHLKMTLNLLDIKHRDSNAQKGNTTQKHQDSVPFSVRALCLCMSIVFVWETLLPSEQIRVDGADGFNVTPTPHPKTLRVAAMRRSGGKNKHIEAASTPRHTARHWLLRARWETYCSLNLSPARPP